ncbi:hypothetical protein OKA05_01555 [Luteolibacter arcticus]|uniref:Tail assembly chaperone n=1 Tax=Luteolibacter arcticus TaxID=1581411 RepID=A0ABT3GC79_9BACT|nr:hypothetical protein [Luteolibacter arcticus]MCW1921217.1 hypothetical protein [Luteolibacter arcticus]
MSAKKGRPKKRKLEPVDKRTPLVAPPDYADPAERQSLKDTVKEVLGIEVPDDDPCFTRHAQPSDAQEEIDRLAATARQHFIDKLRVDPKGEEPLAGTLGSVILNRATPYFEELAGRLFVTALKHEEPAVTAQFFQRVMSLKYNAAAPHRNAFAYYAYSRFIEETEREPTKPELKAYILARRDEFKDAPDESDAKGWTRLWKESGLSDLSAR